MRILLLLLAACSPQPDLCTETAGAMPLYSRPCRPEEQVRRREESAADWWRYVHGGSCPLLTVICHGSACDFFFQGCAAATATCSLTDCQEAAP